MADPVAYPRFHRFVASVEYLAGASLQILNFFKWERCILINSSYAVNTEYGEKFKELLGKSLQKLEIFEVQVASNHTDTSSSNWINLWSDALDEAFDTDIRIVVLNSVQGNLDVYLSEYLYKRGVSLGDYIFFQNYATEFIDEFIEPWQRDIF